MNHTCANCENMKRDDGYLYPYKCKYNKAQRYSEDEITRRIMEGYKCEKYKLGFSEEVRE